MSVYQAGTIKRRRATKDEMLARENFLISYARNNQPVTVRQLFYAATVAGVPGIEKTERGYAKVQSQVLKSRQEGYMPYGYIADGTRWMISPTTFDGWEEALQDTARLYRKNLWADHADKVEIWLEKDALAGVIHPVTDEYSVSLAPTKGYTSETFAHEAVECLRCSGRRLVIYSLYDFDRSGRDAARSLEEKVYRFGDMYEVPICFNRLGLSYEQVLDLDLPTRPPKRNTTADRRWPYEFAAELDAIPPHTLRHIVRDAIEQHLPKHELEFLKGVEKAERDTLLRFIGGELQ